MSLKSINKKKEQFDFDEMLTELGEMGRFQITIYLLVCFPVLFAAANSLSYVFTAGVPNYRCYVPNCDNDIEPDFSASWVPDAIPSNQKHGGSYKPAKCLMYEQIQTNSTDFCPVDSFTDTKIKCDRWVFEEGEKTIVHEWNITCIENQWKLSLVGTMHFVGVIFGTSFFGFVADKYGRKTIFIVSILVMSFSGIAQVVSPDYITFLVFIFLNAFGTAGVYPLAFIIGVELVGKRKREMTGMSLNFFYAIGEALVGVFAWLFNDWIYLQLIVSGPPLIFVIYYWFVPESVRWLLANKKTDKASKIIYKAADVNKVVLSESLLNNLNLEIVESKTSKNDVSIWSAIKEILRSRRMIFRFLAIYFIWTANAFIYYGLSINATTLSGNKYWNFILVCLIEIPGYMLAWFLMGRIGRRFSLSGSLLLCGLTCGIAGFISQDLVWAIVILFLVGKLGITASFGIIYVHTAEMLPTIVRSGGVGSASTVARFGAMVAPFVPLLGIYFESLPMLLFGGTSILAGLFALYLPETLGKKLPESVKEAIYI